MGTDLFTSARGPGVIGSILAVIVLGGFLTLYLLVFGEDFQGGGKTLEYTIQEQGNSLSRLKTNVSEARLEAQATEGYSEIEDQVIQLQARSKAIKERLSEKETEITAAEIKLRKAGEALDSYKQSYRESARAALVGKKYDTLTTAEGKTYQNVSVKDIDAARIQIRHASGITSIALEDLPENIKEFLQIDEAETLARLETEEKERKVRGLNSAINERAYRISRLEAELAASNDAISTSERKIANNRAAIPILQKRLSQKSSELSQHEAKASNGGISNAPQIKAEINGLESKIREAGRNIELLEQVIVRERAEASKYEEQIQAEKELLQSEADSRKETVEELK